MGTNLLISLKRAAALSVAASALTLLASINSNRTALAATEVVESVPVESNLTVPGIRSTQQVWLEMIGKARKTIDLEQFYINAKPGESMDPVLDALRKAAKRGVRIRFLVDKKFYTKFGDAPRELDKHENIEVRTIDSSKLGGIQHAKYLVVDRAQCFIGSANFDWLALDHIHEVGLKIDDSGVNAKLESVFELDWKDGSRLIPDAASPDSASDSIRKGDSSSGKRRRADSQNGKAIEFIASPEQKLPEGIKPTLSAVTELLGAAKKSVDIQVYEYTTKRRDSGTWKTLDEAIRAAAKRGAAVRLLVDKAALATGKNDLKALDALDNVEVRVISIPPWSGGTIPFSRLVHSKYCITDLKSAWVGTENWSRGYFTSSRNVGVIEREQKVVSSLASIFNKVWNSGYTSSP